MNDLSIKIATMEIQIMSLRNEIEKILDALSPQNKGKVVDYERWQSECETVAMELLEKQEESESESNE